MKEFTDPWLVDKCRKCINFLRHRRICGMEPDLGGNCKGFQMGKMPVYTPEFSVMPDTNPHPRRAIAWNSLQEAIDAYEEFIIDCDKWGQVPCPCMVYIGTPDGDEEQYGYPNYPDFVLGSQDGEIVITNA